MSATTSTRELPLIELKLENLTYAPVTVTARGKNKGYEKVTVLNNVTTTISPCKLHAWMGPSGSGKTSLISVAANLVKPNDIVEGSLFTVNGEEGFIPKTLVGVVWQDDLLLSNLTVEENLQFAARLKTPQEVSDGNVTLIVEDTMKELGLLHVRDSLVGSALGPVRGVSGGERKRVSVGIEMVVRPSLLLLDEPTSGLDATTAQSLIATLKHLASKGHSVAVVIHQPRTTIYNMFDHLLLLSKGNMIYDGHPSKARDYLESCPSIQRLPPETGIADWMMDVIIEDEKNGPDKRLLIEAWSKQKEAFTEDWSAPVPVADVEDGPHLDSAERPQLRRRFSSLVELNAAPKYRMSFIKQLKLLTYRTVKQQRGERLTLTAFILQLVYLFFTALFWWRIPFETGRLFERNSLYFFILIAQANGIVVSAVTVFQHERALLSRERAKKMYRVSSYFVAKTLSDMSNNVLLPVLYGSVAYWTANFRPEFFAFVKFIFSLYWSLSTAQSMGLFLSVLIPNPTLALVLAAPITLFFMILGGFYIPFQNMHVGIRWASYLSFARYSYSSMIVNEYAGREIPCSVSDGDGNDSIMITQCPLPGEDAIASLGIEGINESYWFNVGMIILLQVFFRVAAYAQLRMKH